MNLLKNLRTSVLEFNRPLLCNCLKRILRDKNAQTSPWSRFLESPLFDKHLIHVIDNFAQDLCNVFSVPWDDLISDDFCASDTHVFLLRDHYVHAVPIPWGRNAESQI